MHFWVLGNSCNVHSISQWDINKNGFLEKQELVVALRDSGLDDSHDFSEELFPGDKQQIELAEFMAVMMSTSNVLHSATGWHTCPDRKA